MTTTRYNIGTLKTLNLSPYVSEQSDPSTALPTAQPGTPQVSYTINTSTMTPTFSGNAGVVSYKPLYGACVSGQNTSGAAATVYYQINKNGTSFKTGNASIANNNYFTVTFEDNSNNADKYDFYLWTTASSGVNYFYQNVWCLPGRVDTGAKNLSNFNLTLVNFANGTYFPLSGKANGNWNGNINVYPSTASNLSIAFGSTGTGTFTLPTFTSHSTYKLYQLAGEGNGARADIVSNASYYPSIDANLHVSTLNYREIFSR